MGRLVVQLERDKKKIEEHSLHVKLRKKPTLTPSLLNPYSCNLASSLKFGKFAISLGIVPSILAPPKRNTSKLFNNQISEGS